MNIDILELFFIIKYIYISAFKLCLKFVEHLRSINSPNQEEIEITKNLQKMLFKKVL